MVAEKNYSTIGEYAKLPPNLRYAHWVVIVASLTPLAPGGKTATLRGGVRRLYPPSFRRKGSARRLHLFAKTKTTAQGVQSL